MLKRTGSRTKGHRRRLAEIAIVARLDEADPTRRWLRELPPEMQACAPERTWQGEVDNEVEGSPTATNSMARVVVAARLESFASDETTQAPRSRVVELGVGVEAVVLTQTSWPFKARCS